MRKTSFSLLLVVMLAWVLTASVSFAQTPGERFEKAMKWFAANCAKHKLAPGETTCDILKLKPADPLATPEGRFAHSIKIPNPVPDDSGYKPGITPEEYFNHLCQTEAGEFIFKTVENVEGIYMMRPRKEASDYELEHLYALEDPYGFVSEGKAKNARNYLARSGLYRFVETPASADNPYPYQRYTPEYTGKKKVLVEESVQTLQSHFGYIWRGIERPHDRELGIAGGELVVLDLKTNTAVAVRRGYIRSGGLQNLTGIWWLSGRMCPKGTLGRTDFYTFDFLQKVLKPSGAAMSEKGDGHAQR